MASGTSDTPMSSAMQSTGSESASMSSVMHTTPAGSESGSMSTTMPPMGSTAMSTSAPTSMSDYSSSELSSGSLMQSGSSMSMSMTHHSSSDPSGSTMMNSGSSEQLTMTPMPSDGSVVMSSTMMNSSMLEPDQSMTQSQSQTSLDSVIAGSTGGYTMPYYGNSTLMTTISTKSTQSSLDIYNSTGTSDWISSTDAGSGGTPTQTQNRYTPPMLAPTLDSSSLAHRVNADGKLAQAYWCALFVVIVLEVSANMASLI
ncbi:Protein of unknown function [Pyronema omphalodes CBS 100304]|uniref:Uncharacterized protein n=1 Tax=Pyronema omphalodes (strain CBS 100304) TaxID=1076935 RepID=U4LLX8_PYROM|nr:Protein of unknown function [Pyronema omphalodes CBS 100304]